MRKLKANELPRLIFHTDKGLKNEKKTCFFYLAEKNCCFCYFFLLIFITPTTKYISHVILTWIRRDVDGNQCKLLSIWHKIQHHRLERKREQRDSNNISLYIYIFYFLTTSDVTILLKKMCAIEKRAHKWFTDSSVLAFHKRTCVWD
jgi:hypothetical protein